MARVLKAMRGYTRLFLYLKNMRSYDFIQAFYAHHQRLKMGKPVPAFEHFQQTEAIWLACHGLGKLETYQFLYTECNSAAHFQEWLLQHKGIAALDAAADAFTTQLQGVPDVAIQYAASLDDAQLQAWQEQGYLCIPGVVPAGLCNAVITLICNKLGADLANPGTWYHGHPDWHGLMLHLFQETVIQAIRELPAIRQIFSCLYGHDHLVTNTEKVSFNPPETAGWKFRHSALHWDIDFENIDPHYIQGLVYLNDVPENRGPLQVVPGFHHRFFQWMEKYVDPHVALDAVRNTFAGTPIPGCQGDLLLWKHTLPHAASANHDAVPRFVQYVSFTPIT